MVLPHSPQKAVVNSKPSSIWRAVTVFNAPAVSLKAADGTTRLRDVVALVILRHERQWHVAVCAGFFLSTGTGDGGAEEGVDRLETRLLGCFFGDVQLVTRGATQTATSEHGGVWKSRENRCRQVIDQQGSMRSPEVKREVAAWRCPHSQSVCWSFWHPPGRESDNP